MHELFDIPIEKIQLESKLFEDLELDSIDAIDLIGEVQQFSGERMDAEKFKEVRTVQDVVDAAYNILKKANAG